MQLSQLITRLGRSDLKIIGRDRFLMTMVVFAVYIAVVLRYLLPWANVYLQANGVMPGELIPMPLSDMYPMFVAYMAIYVGALLVGGIFGFVLLDERDNNTLQAMLVTPVPLQRYVLYRTGGPAVLAFAIVLAMVYTINLELLPFWQMALFAAGGSLVAPLVALFLASFAENKVQGFAYSKFTGITGMFFLIGWFIPEPWQWLFGLFPPFWIGKAYWMAHAGNALWWVVLLFGIGLQTLLIRWLVGRFMRVMYR